jgi:arabinose-5-phosphate isomerase
MNINIESEIKRVIDIEMKGLTLLREQIGSSVKGAVETIFNCRGKVILTGMGKSGLVAKKIASTMSSVGTPAIFMHPAEGMHGDLGIIAAEDVVIAIGKSGESSELNGVLPSIKSVGAKIIGIMGNGNSTLARYSDVVVDLGDLEEACPLNMAPTTSSTVTMVLGDAMAVALMKMRDFDLADYALLHPGGQIGKRLTMRVSDVMLKDSNNPVINITESVKNCISEISSKLAGAVSVVDNDSKILGLVTDYDIRRHIKKEENIFAMEIKDIMNPDPIFVYEDEKAFSALRMMQEREKPITILSVLDRNNIVIGMLRMHDLVKEGL